jgi:Alpha amylase, catalytic domain
MRKFSRRLTIIAILFSILLTPFRSAPAADFKREVIYQIITDRFFDGSSSNNNPSQSSGLYDATKTNWRAYWGGDLPGIQQKMSYLAGMGVTAIWISPPVDNLNTNIPDGQAVAFHASITAPRSTCTTIQAVARILSTAR